VSPRVTLGIATYERDTYLREAIVSCLDQTYRDLEVLVVLDGGRNPRVDAIVESLDHPRLRVVRHETNLGVSEAYNTIVREGRGELIAMLGDDDVAEPDRVARQVATFDAHPETGVVHGDALIIDAGGSVCGSWRSPELAPGPLLRMLVRRHNYLIDPTRMVHRSVYDAVGGYDPRFRVSQDFHFWLRAAPRFRFRHAPGGPLIRFRRHGDNGSGPAAHGREVEEVSLAIEESLELLDLRTVVPEVDWDLLEPAAARRNALVTLADALDVRELPLPALAARVRERALALPAPRPPRSNGKRIVITSFGFADSGGGTAVPRLTAKELVRRGWQVTVVHAATAPLPGHGPYAISETEQDGVRLVGVHNRPHGLLDPGNPLRELDDPPITRAFARLLDAERPDVVHFHNLHNLGAALVDVAAARGLRSVFSPHNHWLLCPRAYLLRADGSLCAGPGDGSACAGCAGGADPDAYRERFAGLRDRLSRGVGTIAAMSDAIGRALVAAGFPAEMIRVVPQSLPATDAVWRAVGRERRPGRRGGELVVGFFGSVLPHKGPQLLVQAARAVDAPLRVRLHGELPAAMAEALAGDPRVELHGAYDHSELPALLAEVDVVALPSLVWETQGLVASECLAARVPLVVARMGGLAEAVRDGVDGLTFAGGDVAGLARCLERLALEDGLLERLQGAIEAPRPFAAFVDDLEALYDGRPAGRPLSLDPPAVRWVADDHGAGAPDAAAVARLREELPLQRVSRTGGALDPPLPHVAGVEVRRLSPPDLSPAPSGRLALVQPEPVAAVPAEWVEPLRRNVDEVWVPSAAAREAYLQAGLEPDRVHVLAGVAESAAVYAERIRALAARPARLPAQSRLLEGSPAVLATPAWRGEDELPALLRAWADAPAGACLTLLADPATDGEPGELEARVVAAAAGVDLDACPDITILREPAAPGRDASLHAAAEAYVPLHPACAGHVRLAGASVVPLAELPAWLRARAARRAA